MTNILDRFSILCGAFALAGAIGVGMASGLIVTARIFKFRFTEVNVYLPNGWKETEPADAALKEEGE